MPVWVNAGEVFLEEDYEIYHGVDAYAITGFFYNLTEKTGISPK